MPDVDEIVRRAAMAMVRRSIEQLPRCSTRAIEEALWPAAAAQHAHGLLYALNEGEARPVMDAVRAEAKKIVEWMDGQLGHYWMATEEPDGHIEPCMYVNCPGHPCNCDRDTYMPSAQRSAEGAPKEADHAG